MFEQLLMLLHVKRLLIEADVTFQLCVLAFVVVSLEVLDVNFEVAHTPGLVGFRVLYSEHILFLAGYIGRRACRCLYISSSALLPNSVAC